MCMEKEPTSRVVIGSTVTIFISHVSEADGVLPSNMRMTVDLQLSELSM